MRTILPEALEILETHRQELELMVEELEKKCTQSLFDGRPGVFKLMSAEEIDAVHKADTSQKSPA